MAKGPTLILAAALASIAPAAAQETGSLGAGVVVGDPTGGSARWFLSRGRSLDAGVGFSGDAALWLDHSWHAWDLLPAPRSGRLGAWVGAGLRLETKDDPEFGIRTKAGASYWLPNHPIEVFAEAGPVFVLTPDGGVGADGGVGVRFYFGRS